MKIFWRFSLILVFGLFLTGCGKASQNEEVLLCQTNEEKYVFSYDNRGNIDSIYYEKNFDFNDYYTTAEIEDFKTYNFFLFNVLNDKMLECDNKEYACYSRYSDYKIVNKYYVKNKEEAVLVGLEDYYGDNYNDVKGKLVNEDMSCEKETTSKKYIVEGNKTEIRIEDKVYSSLRDYEYEINKKAYLKEYTLTEIDDKKATIEFKDNGVCVINLKEFDSQSWNGTYCKEGLKNLSATTYLDGNCTYEVYDHKFVIKYDGKYEISTSCGSSIIYDYTYDILNKSLDDIELEFDENYETFKYLNGNWERKYDNIGPLIYNASN